MMRPCTMRITYLDDELMIIRDHLGHPDVLWRTKPLVPQPPVSHTERVTPSAPSPTQDVHEKEPAVYNVDYDVHEEDPVIDHKSDELAKPALVEHVSKELEAVKETLDVQLAQHASNMDELLRVTQRASEVEKALRAASVDSQASSTQLQVQQSLKERACEDKARRTVGIAERAHRLKELEAEVSSMETAALAHQSTATRARARHDSLKAQIAELASEARRAARSERPTFQVALARAKEELQATRQEAREAERAAVDLSRRLKKTAVQVRRQKMVVEADAADHAAFVAKLDGQRRECQEQQARVESAIAKEQALGAELQALRERLGQLEAQSAEGRDLGAKLEQAMGDIAARAREAGRVARTLQGRE